MASFPKPYINSIPSKDGDDAMIQTVPFDKMSIGANSTGLPKNEVNSSSMTISHVGGTKDSR